MKASQEVEPSATNLAFSWLAIVLRQKGFSGGYTGVVPLLPIPNRTVKYSKADDSRVSRRK